MFNFYILILFVNLAVAGRQWEGCVYSPNKDLGTESKVVTVRNRRREGSLLSINLKLDPSPLLPSTGICPKPIKNRDVVTLRSWQVTADEYLIVNFSVKHPVRRLLLLHTLPRIPFLQINDIYCLPVFYAHIILQALVLSFTVICFICWCQSRVSEVNNFYVEFLILSFWGVIYRNTLHAVTWWEPCPS